MPKTVEVDETQFLAQNSVVDLVNKILKNPDARKAFHDAAKKVDPSMSIPEVDAKNEVLGEVEKVRAEFNDFKKAVTDKEAAAEAAARTNAFAASWENQKNSLRQEGWMDEGIAAVEKLAQDRGIVDLEAAALLHQKLNPPPAPVTTAGFGFSLFEAPDTQNSEAMKKLMDSHGDDEGALNTMVRAALNDVRGGQRRVA